MWPVFSLLADRAGWQERHAGVQQWPCVVDTLVVGAGAWLCLPWGSDGAM